MNVDGGSLVDGFAEAQRRDFRERPVDELHEARSRKVEVAFEEPRPVAQSGEFRFLGKLVRANSSDMPLD